MELTTALAIASLLVLFLFFTRRRKQLPAGSRPIPGPSLFRGLVSFVKESYNKTLHLKAPEWARQYGDLVQIDLMIGKVVIVNNSKVYRQMVKSPQYKSFTNDRPPFFTRRYFNDITTNSYSEQVQFRRTTLHNLLNFYGEGVGQFESLMTTTLKELVETLEHQDNVNLSHHIRWYIISLVSFLLSGDISKESKENVQKLLNMDYVIDELLLFENDTLLQFFSFLRFIPGLRFRRICRDISITMEEVFKVYLYDMKKTYNPDIKRGMVDELLAKQDELKGKEGNIYDLGDDVVKGCIIDITSAAFMTTFSTLSHLFLQLIKNPEIQDRLYQEISEVIGAATPSFSHMGKMPYTKAAINETMRHHTGVPLLIAHAVREDFVFDGYFIQKGTMLLMNNWYTHHNEETFDNPWSFEPERLLDKDGQYLESTHPLRQEMLPFGTGPRGCPGENFARSRMFLILTTLLQHFQFLAPDNGESLPSSDPRSYPGSLILHPSDFYCKLVPRQ